MTKDEKLCPLTHAGMGYWLKSLAKRANIVPRGRIHFHMLRKFLMSALANSNINTWHIKLMVGKSISNDIFTYLKNQTKTLREEYKRAEPNFILGEISNGIHNVFEKQAKTIGNLEEIAEVVARVLLRLRKEESGREEPSLPKGVNLIRPRTSDPLSRTSELADLRFLENFLKRKKKMNKDKQLKQKKKKEKDEELLEEEIEQQFIYEDMDEEEEEY